MNYTKWIRERLLPLLDIPRQLASLEQTIREQGEATRAAYEKRAECRIIKVKFDENEAGDRKRSEEKQRRIQNSIRRATWATFLAAIIYGGLTLLLWRNAREQLEMEQRSWVVFDPSYSDTVALGADKTSIAVPLRLENIGKTPAEAVDGFVAVEELKPGEKPQFSYHPDRAVPIYIGILYPGANYAQTRDIDELAEGRKPVPVNEARRKQFTAGKLFFNVWGRFVYFDVFQQKHWVQFCHAIAEVALGKTVECANYNRVDPPASKWELFSNVFWR